MNENNGLSSLPDKSVELCFTDPEYFIFDTKWIDQILRICKGLIFTPGKDYLYDYITYKKPNYHIKYWYCPNGLGTYLIEPFLCHGKISKISHIREVIDIPFSKLDYRVKDHPYPKLYKVYEYFIKRLNPKSVIDPFIGSGTTAEVCTKLGIKWLGYEINEVYKHDIDRRLNDCKTQLNQKRMF